MASDTVAINSQKFNWAEDVEDDFDLDSWNATADTSAPTADELGPLQVPPTEDETQEEEEVYTLSRIRNERAYWNPPATKEPSGVEPTMKPEPAVQLPAEHWHLAVLSCRPEHQVKCAQYEHIIHAIGVHYEGKEESEAPAYPELSYDDSHRSSYARGFQNWKLEHGGLSSTKVYRNSPLNIVTSIDEAHEIDDIADPEDGEVLNEYEAMHVAALEETEQNGASDSEAPEREMNEEIDRMIDDQITNHIDQFQWFSRRELEDLYHQFKAQQLTGEEVSDGDDSDSEDGYDEDAYEPYNACAEDDESSFSITRPFTAADTEEELDFNDVVFGGDTTDEESETHHGTDSEPSDEGYVSSSPPDTSFLDNFNHNGDKNTHTGLLPIAVRLSTSSLRRKTICQTDSMDALQAFRQTARFEQRIDDAFEDDEDEDVSEKSQQDVHLGEERKNMPDAVQNSEFVLVVTPPPDQEQMHDYLVNHATLSSPQKAPVFESDEENEQVTSIKDESRGVLNQFFTFPSLPTAKVPITSEETGTSPTAAATCKPSSRRWSDPTKYDPALPSGPPSRSPRHTKHNSLALDYLTGAVSSSWLYMGQVPWTQVGIMTVGVVAGGLLGMARRH